MALRDQHPAQILHPERLFPVHSMPFLLGGLFPARLIRNFDFNFRNATHLSSRSHIAFANVTIFYPNTHSSSFALCLSSDGCLIDHIGRALFISGAFGHGYRRRPRRKQRDRHIPSEAFESVALLPPSTKGRSSVPLWTASAGWGDADADATRLWPLRRDFPLPPCCRQPK
jgi:hypothetical protein